MTAQWTFWDGLLLGFPHEGKLQGPHHDEDYEGELSKNSTYHGVCELVANENVLRNIPGTYQLQSINPILSSFGYGSLEMSMHDDH